MSDPTRAGITRSYNQAPHFELFGVRASQKLREILGGRDKSEQQVLV